MDERTKSSPYAIMTNFESLNCPYCCDRLTIPTFQCLNGHVACSICWPKLKGRCPQCYVVLGTSRCRSIENVIGNLLIRCPNKAHGCAEIIPYSKVRKHILEACKHSQCYCPLVNTCSYGGCRQEVYAHYINLHQNPNNRGLILFGSEQEAVVSISNGISIYHDLGTDVLFVLQTFRHDNGLYITIAYIADQESILETYSYKLQYKCGDNIFSRNTLTMKSINKVSFDRPEEKNCLYIPNGYLVGAHISLTLCITKFVYKRDV